MALNVNITAGLPALAEASRGRMLERIGQGLPPVAPLVEVAYPGLASRMIDWMVRRDTYFHVARSIGAGEDIARAVLDETVQEAQGMGWPLDEDMFRRARGRLYDRLWKAPRS